MPTHKGIKINLVSQWELRVHPEFPHPESSQFTFRSPKLERLNGSGDLPSTKDPLHSESDQPLGRQSSVSVYVPSCSGARFWVRWTITEAAIEESQWYYFKLFMNGRHITSWGTNAYEKPSGQVMRGLFEPSERWNYKNEGIIYKNMGTEARPFIFAEEGESRKSAAIDGGLIEVQAFRAQGRKRKLAEPTDFKNQESYGIIGGLLDKPQDAKYYDWHLKDPKDNPFAIFSFHYRSWDSLYSLQLIPPGHPRALLSPTPSVLTILGQVHGLQFELADLLMDGDDKIYPGVKEEAYDDDWEDETELSKLGADDLACGSVTSESSTTPWMTAVFDESPPTKKYNDRRLSSGLQYDKAPVHPDPRKVDLVSRFSSAATESPRFKDKAAREQRQKVLNRPLPNIPQRTSSKRNGRPRSSSTASGAPSITPSLCSYVERGENSSPEPFIGVATVASRSKVIFRGSPKLVDIPRRKSKRTVSTAENTPPVSSFEEDMLDMCISRPLPTPGKFTPPIRTSSAIHQPKPLESPLGDFCNQPGITNVKVRKHKRSPGTLLSRLSISGSSFKPSSPFRSNSTKEKSEKVLRENTHQTLLPGINTAISVTESEWMCRTPSPVKSPNVERYGSIWSPSPGSYGKKARRNPEHGSQGISSESPTHVTSAGGPNKPARNGRANKNENKSTANGTPIPNFHEGARQRDEGNEAKRMNNESPVLAAPIKRGAESVERRISGKERLSRRAMGWYDQVRTIGDEKADQSSLSLDDSKVRTGWI